MKDQDRHNRIELIPDADPELVKAALQPIHSPNNDTKNDTKSSSQELNLDDDDSDEFNSDWLDGNDPEADVVRTSDHRNSIKRQMRSVGAQFVVGVVILAVSLGALALAATIRTTPYLIAAAIICPIGFWMFQSRWKRWLGSAPYFYKLLTSLGEDAENVLVAHEDKQRKKYVNAIGDLYEHSRPNDKKK